MAFEDVQVVIDVNKPGSLTGLGTPLILVSHTEAGTYTEFTDAASVKLAYGDNHSAYKIALVLENQGQYRPSKIAVATYSVEKTSDVVLRDVFDNDWYFVILDAGEIAEKKKISEIVEGKDFKMAAHLVTSTVEAEALKELAYERTILFGITPELSEEYANAALIGACGSRTVGEITWKFKSLVGVTPMNNTTQALAYTNANANIYINTSGKPKTREGVVASGEFIDVIHGIDFIKVNAKNAIDAVLNNSAKIAFEDSDIALLTTALTDTLELAGRQGIIARSDNGQFLYTVNALSRSEVTAAERASRVYRGLSFDFELAGAIHKVAPIKGVVNY
ncbi:DUF3383 family protein [Lysinibacillus sp. 54212]|uniref:DUF3383 family protein n=1 Tax=Lysinibacillus sp. 54212 TaxID=3119829 RepID=UPI002FCC1E34